MQYTIVLSPEIDGTIAVSIPLLPQWFAKADTREEAITSARAAITNFIAKSEVLTIDIPENGQPDLVPAMPWEWFGIGQSDLSWDELFDDIERERDATREIEWLPCIFGTQISCAPSSKVTKRCKRILPKPPS